MTSSVRRGCILVNLGSPAAASPKEIRRFLRSFLSDRRVVDFPRPAWMAILHAFVLPMRPRRILPEYQRVWLDEGSPLTVFTKAQAEALAAELPEVEVRWAMCYSHPTVPEVLAEMSDCDEITILPAYPQYASSTVAPIMDLVSEFYRTQNYVPTLRFVNSYSENRDYANWYADKIAQALEEAPADRLVVSYHGVPNREVHFPEGYRAHCTQTTQAIMDALAERGIQIDHLQTYQSKFGPGEWLKPATIDTIGELPSQGVRDVLVVTPGFLADCIETISEIGHLNKETFLEAGGQSFRLLPPLNDDGAAGPILASVYAGVTERHR